MDEKWIRISVLEGKKVIQTHDVPAVNEIYLRNTVVNYYALFGQMVAIGAYRIVIEAAPEKK